MAEIKFEIVEHIGVISEQSTGWKRELNIVSWNDRPPKFDLRDWSPDHEKMSKGITFTEEEIRYICDLMVDYVQSTEREETPC